MRILSLFIIIITQLLLSVSTYAVGEIRESDLNVRNINITDTGKQNEVLDRFISPVREFFFSAGSYG